MFVTIAKCQAGSRQSPGLEYLFQHLTDLNPLPWPCCTVECEAKVIKHFHVAFLGDKGPRDEVATSTQPGNTCSNPRRPAFNLLEAQQL